MNLSLLAGAFSAGLLIGLLIAFVICRSRLSRQIAETRGAGQAELAVLGEKLSARESDLRGLQNRLTEFEEESRRLRESLLKEGQEKAAAQKEVEQLADLKTALQERERESLRLREEVSLLKQNRTELETILRKEQETMAEKIAFLNEAGLKMEAAFKALSAECLRTNNQQFLDLARSTLEKFQSEARGDLEQRQKAVETTIRPLKETLEKYVQQVQAMETARQQAYGSLSQYLESMAATEQKLQLETGNLVKALRAPQVRGRWGEITLRRVAELAGMSEHCDFTEQETVQSEEGRLRPDMVVHLPNNKLVVVDSKAPLQAYLESLECQTEEEQKSKLREHARLIQVHLQKLSAKNYWDQFPETPEFVILFLPGENFFSAALEQNPLLIEQGVNQKVILATPTTLITLLRAVAYGWRQEQLTENAQAISELGKILYERLAKLASHLDVLGKFLDKSVQSFNEAVGSLESRVLTAARRFKDFGISSKYDIAELQPLERTSRSLQAPELLNSEGEELKK